jgi:U3 small nucleolar RNA-associated protein 18
VQVSEGVGGYTAVGSESGVVNVYSNSQLVSLDGHREGTVRPLKALMNLTTTIDSLLFNTDAQVLAMASRWKKDALRLVHLPSLTVFSNWPTGRTPIRYPFALDFSPNGGCLSVGNDRGRVLLYRLRHYEAS